MKTKRFIVVIAGILVVLLCNAISFVITYFTVKLVCYCFDWTFTSKIALGVWVILSVLGNMFKKDKQ